MNRVYFLIFTLIIFSLTCLSQQLDSPYLNYDSQPDIKITAEDKAQIVQAVLSTFDFSRKELRDNDGSVRVLLSTENIELKSVPIVHGIEFGLYDTQVVRDNEKTRFSYYAFQKFKVTGSKVYVSFAKIYVDSGYREQHPRSSGSPDSITGVRYEFRKVSGKWQGHIINGFQKMSLFCKFS